jgi:GxxExxY protein
MDADGPDGRRCKAEFNKRYQVDLNEPFLKETEAIIGAAFEVINTLGHGLLEKPYENALCVEFASRDIPFTQQQRFEIMYKGSNVGLYMPDLIAFEKVVVEAKVVDRITDQDLGQVMNYLRITQLPVGLILNFKRPRLEVKRVTMSEFLR